MTPGECDSEIAVDLAGVTKTFRGKAAVSDLSLQIPNGTIFGFIGPNGSGKTTTIRMMMGLLPSDSGTIRVLGHDPAERPLRQRVGYVPEQHFIYRWMRVREVIRFCRAMYDTWNDRLCQDLLGQFELPLEIKVKHLSKGMLVKLALLAAVAHEPELLVLDEPTSGLDPIVREEFLDGVLRTACGKGQTVFFSSHNLQDVQRMADSVGIIFAGRLLCHNSVDGLLTRTKRIRLFLEEGHLPADLADGVFCRHIRPRECTLTIAEFGPDVLERLNGYAGVQVLEVADVSLEEIFKDYVMGRRAEA